MLAACTRCQTRCAPPSSSAASCPSPAPRCGTAGPSRPFRAALASDARRYNMLVVNGWTVLRFSYEDVMFHPDEVRRVLVAAVALAELLVEVGIRGRPAA